MYNCNFCEQNIDRYEIENHFVTFHKFRGTANNRKQKSNHLEAKMKSFEDGKSKFLQLMTNFESEKDALSLYYWIKSDTLEVLKLFVQDDLKNSNETDLNNEEMEHDFPILDEKISEEEKHRYGNNIILNSVQEGSTDLSLHQQEIFQEDFPHEFQVENEDLGQETFQANNAKQVIFQEEVLEKTDLITETNEEEEDGDKSDLISLLDYALGSENENSDGIKQKLKSENEFVCFACGRVFSKKQDMLKHIHNIHKKEEKKYKCYSCRKTFSTFRNLKKHMQEIHDPQNKNPKFKTESLETHNSSVPTNPKCDTCSRSFCDARSLKKHIYAVHEGHKDHKCNLCGKLFTQAVSLKRHIKSSLHNGQKDYACESCGKTFFQAANGKKHKCKLQTPMRINPKCDTCGKSFSDASSLKKHFYVIHEDHKDHNCESCGKLFTQAGSLKRHIQTIHEKCKEYKCGSCSKLFGQKSHLKNHTYLVHELLRKSRQ